jgi:hypothetical protein
LRKYGFEAHTIKKIWEGDCLDFELSIIESFWITAKESYLTGMNLTKGGDGGQGLVLSKESRLKISLAHRGRKGSEKQKDVVRKRFIENNPMRNEECKRKMANARKGMVFSEEHKRKLFEKVNTPEAREKSRLSKIGKRMGSENHNAKPVVQMKEGKFVADFDSAATASRNTGVIRANITKCCTGKRTVAGGFNWKFK